MTIIVKLPQYDYRGLSISRYIIISIYCPSLIMNAHRNEVIIRLYVSGFEKRAHFAQRPKFWVLITHNFKAVIATDLKPGITILQSLHYTCCKFCALPTSGLGVVIASITRGQKSAILCFPLVLHHFRQEDSYTF